MKTKGFWLLILLLLNCPILSQAQLTWPGHLRNELDLNLLDDTARNVVVLIHGWTGKSSVALDYSRYADSADAPEMNFLFTILKFKLSGSNTKLVTYHWEKDASTGLVDHNPLNGAYVQDAINNSTAAANHAVPHGSHLAELLNDQAPDLRRVHFIAHSAGSWAAREAALEILRLNPYVVVQVTLLDPYIPGAVPPPWTPSTTLNAMLMEDIYWHLGSSRIYLVENYFADDLPPGRGEWPTMGTQTTFSWVKGGTNLQIEWDPDPLHTPGVNLYYDWHSGPVMFYGDTVQAAIPGQPVFPGLYGIRCPFDYKKVGWNASLTANSGALPDITTHPQKQNASPGQQVTLSVVASSSQAMSYQWYRNGEMIIGAETASYSFTASAGAPVSYAVRVSNANGSVFSERASVSVYASVPAISSVSPNLLSPSTSPQLLTISGANFKGPAESNPSRLIFYDPAGNATPLRTPSYVSPGQLQYNATLPVSGTWKLKVVNGEMASLPYSFTVSSGAVQLSGLSISGPSTVDENTSGQFVANAIFSDGSVSAVNVSWAVSSGAASISAAGVLLGGSVTANTLVTVSASYTSGGVTKTTAASVTIVDAGGDGGYDVQQLIVNGDFSSGSSGWTRAGNFQADSRFSTCRSCPGYAYLANFDGTPGNAISGTLSQTFTIPTDALEAALDYWHRTTTAEIGGAADYMTVQLRRANGSLVGLDTISNTDANSSYSQRSIDLTSYKGQTLTLEFVGVTSASSPTTFRVDDVSVTVTIPRPPTPVSLVISGPSSVTEGGAAQYYATMIYSDGSTATASALTWGNNTPSVVSFTSGGRMSAQQVSQDTTVTIYTSAQIGGQTYQAFKDVKIVDRPTFISLAISGPTSMNENSSSQFTATANFSDGSAQTVSANWSISSGTGSVSEAGLLTVGGLNSDMITTLSATYAIGGTTRSATHDVLVLNTSSPPKLESLVISGPNAVQENSTAEFTGIASFDDGSSLVVNPKWDLVSTCASISQFGLFSSGEVLDNTTVLLSASYDTDGITRSATKDVTVMNGVTAATGPYEAKWSLPLSTFRVYASAPAQNGGLVLFGTFTGTILAGGRNLTATGGESDFFGVKLDSDHKVVWVKQFGLATEEEVDSCAQHPSGGWVIAGHFSGSTTIGSVALSSGGDSDAFLARVDEEGNVLWAKRGGGSSTDYGNHAGVDSAGNCFLFGLFTESAIFSGGGVTLNATGTQFDIFVAKYSSSGDFLWAKSVGGPKYDEVYCAKVDAAGNAYIGGIFEKQASYGPYTLGVVGVETDWDAFLAKLSPSGEVLWAKRFGQSTADFSTEGINFIAPVADGTCFVGGQYEKALVLDGQALPDNNSWTPFVGKLNSEGAVEWLRAIRPERIGFVSSFARAEKGLAAMDGGLFFSGSYRGKFTFGSTVCSNSTSANYQYLAKIDAAGTAKWAVSSTGSGLNYVESLIPAGGERVRMLGRASGQPVAFPGIPSLNATADDTVLIEFGLPEIVAPPTLRVSIAGDKIVLTWPAATTGFILESTTNIPTASWVPNAVVPALVGGNFTITNEISGGARFYRLKRQEFANLDFEAATISPTAVGEYGVFYTDPKQAFPGWTMGEGGSLAANQTLYNNLTLGSVAQVLVGPQYPNGIGYAPLQGNYSALLQFGPSSSFGYPALAQKGVVPSWARSINFLVSGSHNDARVTIDGQEVNLRDIGGGRIGGNINGSAGRNVELKFTTKSYDGSWLYFDDVVFSPSMVPE